jgi:hypothetical protein
MESKNNNDSSKEEKKLEKEPTVTVGSNGNKKDLENTPEFQELKRLLEERKINPDRVNDYLKKKVEDEERNKSGDSTKKTGDS